MLSQAYATLFYESNRESVLQLIFNLATYILFIWILIMLLSLIRIVIYLGSLIGVVFIQVFFRKSNNFHLILNSAWNFISKFLQKTILNSNQSQIMIHKNN